LDSNVDFKAVHVSWRNSAFGKDGKNTDLKKRARVDRRIVRVSDGRDEENRERRVCSRGM
jgi:hypothetical protein